MRRISRILTFGWIAVSIVLDCTNLSEDNLIVKNLQLFIPCAIIVVLLVLAVKESCKEENDREDGYIMETFSNIFFLVLFASLYL